MERKEFIKKFAVGGSILLSAPVLFNACSSDDGTDDEDTKPDPKEVIIDLTDADNADLGTVGGYINKGEIIVIRASQENFIALSNVCTHAGCTVTYNASDGDLPCPCHGSKFSTSGAVLNGPATSALKKYTVKKEGDLLKIT